MNSAPLRPLPPPTGSRAARAPFHAMIKPVGAQCNLRCDYCFYLDKGGLYPGRKAAQFRMRDEVLEASIRALIDARAPGQDEVLFAWQGGEPTLMGLAFFERVVALQEKYAPAGVRIRNSVQSNGLLLDDDFARFFHAHAFLVGVSIDGPQAVHDRHRRNAAGRGSFTAVMQAIDRLNEHRVEYNLLTVVHSGNAPHPEQLYGFLRELGSPFLQFIPLVEPDAAGGVSALSVGGVQWGEFLTRVFHRWRERDIGRIFVQHFDMLLGVGLGYPATLCVHAAECGRGVALEHNGDVYSCDHFVDRGHLLGNITATPLAQMVDSPFQQAFGRAKSAALPQACRACRFVALCQGGCPKDRLIATDSGPLNWLCAGYAAFYGETAPYFQAMAHAVRQRLPAGEYRRFMPRAAKYGDAAPAVRMRADAMSE